MIAAKIRLLNESHIISITMLGFPLIGNTTKINLGITTRLNRIPSE